MIRPKPGDLVVLSELGRAFGPRVLSSVPATDFLAVKDVSTGCFGERDVGMVVNVPYATALEVAIVSSQCYGWISCGSLRIVATSLSSDDAKTPTKPDK